MKCQSVNLFLSCFYYGSCLCRLGACFACIPTTYGTQIERLGQTHETTVGCVSCRVETRYGCRAGFGHTDTSASQRTALKWQHGHERDWITARVIAGSFICIEDNWNNLLIEPEIFLAKMSRILENWSTALSIFTYYRTS